MKNLIKISAIAFISLLALTGCNKEETTKEGLNIITTNFVSYDAARAVVGDEANIEMLIKPGNEIHTLELSPKDITNIKKSDVFIYVGGESDEWIENIVDDIDTSKTKVIRLIDVVELKEEEIKEGMEHSHNHEHEGEHHDEDADEHHNHEGEHHDEDADEHHDHEGEHHDEDADEHHNHEGEHHDEDADEHHDHEGEHHDEDADHNEEEHEYDEHVWTSPVNYIKIVNEVSETIISVDEKNENKYEKNTEKYVNELKKIDNDFEEIVENSENKTLIFGDRFPFRYFVEEYDLDYYAAFPGCSADTEASASTIAFLIDKINETKTKYILTIELSSEKIANTIREETGVEIITFNAGHNMSKEDFEEGTTMVDIMKSNVKVLDKVLNETN